MSQQIVISEKKDHCGILTLDNPATLNALTHSAFYEMKAVLEDFNNDPEVRVIIITGAGEKAFCSGGDIKEELELDTLGFYKWSQLGHAVLKLIEDSKKPSIAAINGYCLGGGFELALACDMRICSSNAKLGAPESKLGLICGFGGNIRLPRLVGKSKAKELLMTGKMISAQEAMRIGLVNDVVPQEQLWNTVTNLCAELINKSMIVLDLIKCAVNYGTEIDFASAVQFDSSLSAIAGATEDKIEGMTAFLEKRTPVFKDR